MKLFISNFQKKLIVIFFSSCRISEKLCQFFNTFFCGHSAGTALKVEGRVRQKIITFHSWEESYFFQYIMQTCFFRTTLSDRISYYNLAPASELSILYNLPCYTLQKFRWTYVKFYFNLSVHLVWTYLCIFIIQLQNIHLFHVCTELFNIIKFSHDSERQNLSIRIGPQDFVFFSFCGLMRRIPFMSIIPDLFNS